MTFQERTEQELRRLFDAKGCVATFEIVGDARKISCNGCEFWVYPDGAGVLGPSVDKRFEIYDYDSLRALQAAYLVFIRDLL